MVSCLIKKAQPCVLCSVSVWIFSLVICTRPSCEADSPSTVQQLERQQSRLGLCYCTHILFINVHASTLQTIVFIHHWRCNTRVAKAIPGVPTHNTFMKKMQKQLLWLIFHYPCTQRQIHAYKASTPWILLASPVVVVWVVLHHNPIKRNLYMNKTKETKTKQTNTNLK